MGRPIKSSNFGDPTSGRKIVMVADIGNGNEQCYIVAQKGTAKYKVAAVIDSTRTGVVRLQEAVPSAEGEAQLDCSPFGAGGSGGGAVVSVATADVQGITFTSGGTVETAVGAVIALSGGTQTTQADFSVTAVQAVSASLNEGGTGYVVGDVLTATGGTGTQATFTVTSVDGGIISGVEVTTGGAYTVRPTNPITVTGGTGGGAALDVVMGPQAATVNTAGNYSVSPANDATVGTDATATIEWGILSVSIDAAGQDYTVGATVTVLGSADAVLAVASVNGSGGITGITITNGGTDLLPSGDIKIDIESVGAEQVKKLTQKQVHTYQGNTYNWVLDTAAAVGGPAAVIQSVDLS